MSNYSVTSGSKNHYSYNSPEYSSHRAYITKNQNTQPPGNIFIQQGAKCPHGVPGGACPVCMGKTGGGGGSENNDKKRTGMSWGEAYYVYTMIQKNKLLAKEDQQLNETARQRLQMLEKLYATRLYQGLMALKNRALELAAKLQATVLQIRDTVTKTLIKPAIETVNKIINILKHTAADLIGVVNKLTALFGEKLKITADAIRDNIRKMIVKLREAEFLSRLISVFNEKRQVFQDLLLRKIESLKEKIQKFTTMITFISKKDSKEQKKRKNRAKNKKKKLKRVSEITC